jgi:hypothetical protein
MAREQSVTKTTTNRAEIRRWVESKGGWPARVKGSERGNDPGILRIDFPGYSGIETLAKMSWDDWFKWFDKKGLAFLHQPSTRFTKLIGRDTTANGARTRATPRRATGAKRATSKRGTAKRATAKRAGAAKKGTATRATRARQTATASRNGTKRGTATKRGMAAKRGTAKRTAKRPATKRTAKRTGAKRTSTKHASR